MLLPNIEIPEASLNKLTLRGSFDSSTNPILGTLDSEGREFLFKSRQNTIAHCDNSLYFIPYGPNADLSISIPNIIQAIRREESVIVFSDCANTIIRYTNEYARRQGYTTRYINFRNPGNSHGFDLLGAIQNDSFLAHVIASTIMANTSLTEGHDIHEKLEKDLLTALLLLVSAAPSEWIAPEAKGLTAILNCLNQTPASMDSLFSLGRDDPQFRAAWEAYSPHRQGSDRLRCAIMNGLKNRLQHIADPQYSGLCAADDVDLTLPAREKCIYYVDLPISETLQPLCASLLQLFLFSLEHEAENQLDGLPVVPVNVLIKNPCDIGALPQLDGSLSCLLGRNIPITFMVPSKFALEELYGKDAVERMIDGCSLVGCLHPLGEAYRSFMSWYQKESGTSPYDMIKSMRLVRKRDWNDRLLLFWREHGWKIAYPVCIDHFQEHGQWYTHQETGDNH